MKMDENRNEGKLKSPQVEILMKTCMEVLRRFRGSFERD
jgi:hypothetical protein